VTRTPVRADEGSPAASPGSDPGPCDGPALAGGPAPCRAACPVGTDAAAYVALVAEGRLAEAYDVARAPNPLASICGRICAAPCETACRRGVLDQPIAIRALKRVLAEAWGAESELRSRWRRAIPSVPPATRPSVGIVGAGPAGLSAAHDLRLAGHDVVLYEREERVGGMLAYGVPPFRLPHALLDQELGAILDLGVTLRTGCEVGRDASIEELLDEHAAVLVSAGCQQGRLLETPGVELPGVIRAVDFLRRVNAPRAEADAVEGPVVVIGGGSVAFDAARSAWRLQGVQGGHGQTMLDVARTAIRTSPGAGPRAVTLVAPESRAELEVPPEELEQAEQEGVVVHDHLGVQRVLGDGRVEGVEVSPVLSLLDEQGRFAPRLDASRAQVLPARTVVLAIGQQADVSFLSTVSGLERGGAGGVDADRWGRTAHPRLFAAGDVASGPRDLIDAVASGQRAASAIVQALAGGDRAAEPPVRAVAPAPAPAAPPLGRAARYWSGYDAIPRARLPLRPAPERSAADEVEGPLGAGAARAEGERCLRCDEHLQLASHRCVACGLCADVCPTGCLALRPAGRRVALVFDGSPCIRCRLCVDRCPADALGFALAPQ